MTTSPTAPGDESPSSADVDVLVVGAGITGIYQLYRARQAGFSVQLLEAGDGVGGTWYWNRYPGARFDSESYTYGYLFSAELFDEWEWQEHFAAQPETERYLNHVVDRFDLRRHIRCGARVTSAVWDDRTGTWLVGAADGTEVRARFVVAATGVLSIPYIPDVEGRDSFRGRAIPHRPLARRTGRLRGQAGGRRRHLVERRAGRSRHRRRGVLADRLPTHGQLVHTAQQPAHHAGRAGRAPGRTSPRCVRRSTPPSTVSSTRRTTVRRSRIPKRRARRSTRPCGTAPGSPS